MKQESGHPSIDPELEVRIVALVLGEASDFERDELERLIQLRPELAAFKSEIENVNGLLDLELGDNTRGARRFVATIGRSAQRDSCND